MNSKAYRLPRSVLPRQYDVALEARPDAEEVRGRVSIQVDVREPTTTVELNSVGIDVQDTQISANGYALPGTVALDGERELATIQFERELPVGPATLDIAFRRPVSNSLEGLYLAKDADGVMLSTQCEPTAARQIFPCFDEPTFKARFAYTITTAPDLTVLTNGRLVSATASADGSAKTWTFAPTKPMSSYLVAISIGDIASTREVVVRDVPLRIWALRGKEQMGEFGLEYTARLLPFYEEYFGTPYHFEKLDQIGIPAFAAGAMENAGLITYRQTALLMDPATASWDAEKWIATVIAHEFAHMWFGDLVTMRWWDDLWLNEAFASWLSYHAVQTLTPEYDIWDEVQRFKDHVMDVDSLASSHPIYNRVETPSDAMEMFDEITYEKGCAILRMLHNFLGDEAFKQGLQGYLREFAEGNAAGGDLWRNLQQASNEPVSQIMESWILQAGQPIVSVALEGSGGETRLRLTQGRFFSSQAAMREPNEQLWSVPLVIRYQDDAGVHETRGLLAERETTLPLQVTGALAWCYANAGEVGFYRLQPDAALLQGLLANIERVSVPEQIGLLRDQWALVQNGSQSITPVLDVIATLARSDDYRVLRAVTSYLRTLEDYLEDAGDAEALAGFRAWAAATFSGKLAALGYEPRKGESRNEEQARVSVVSAMTRFAQDAEAIAQARQWAAREAEDPNAVDANLAPVFVNTNARFGDAAVFDKHVAIYRQRKAAGGVPEQAERYLETFPLFRQPELVSRTLALIDDGTVAAENEGGVLGQLLMQRYGQDAAWNYMKVHWKDIEERLTFFVPVAVAYTGNLPISYKDDVTAFFDAHLNGQFQNSLARAMATMEQTAEVKARTRDELVAWFRGRGGRGN